MDPLLGTDGRPGARAVSLWWDDLPGPVVPRPAPAGDLDVDVAIVGAGFTGLWTAYYLRRADPSVRVAVLEAEVAGYGASGRNGGWCSALFPAPAARLARLGGRDGAVRLLRALQETVDEVGRVAAAEGIDAGFAKGGTVALARTPAQVARARAEVAEARGWGFGAADLRWLDAAEARDVLAARGVLGATYTPHCARVHPARLVRGLADAVVRAGAALYEGTRVCAVAPGRLRTAYGTVRATYVVRATEGYTAALPGLRRAVAPLYSLMVATAPLDPATWDRLGLRRAETFTDHRRLVVYGQRTADGRVAFGGRGAPYHFGSQVRPDYDRDPRVFAALRTALHELLPEVAGVPLTHAWGGPLGVARDWTASVGLDRATGLAWAGGYVGDGVGTANLAGRTLTDLVLGRDTDLRRLPWVGHRSPRWEPEPLRWLGINAALRLTASADAAEARTGQQARRAALVDRLLGR